MSIYKYFGLGFLVILLIIDLLSVFLGKKTNRDLTERAFGFMLGSNVVGIMGIFVLAYLDLISLK